jgi:two-component system, OmpR family, response regulator
VTVGTEILVVDDDPEIRHLLCSAFRREGYLVHEASDRRSVLAHLKARSVDLMTLDLTLGQDDGLSLAREVRGFSDVPIIMVTGKGDPIDRVVGLELGADDYICKPFNLRETVARVRAVLRRQEPARPGTEADLGTSHEQYVFSHWNLDLTSRVLMNTKGEPRDLTTGEFNMLTMFVRRPHRVMTRDEIMDQLKGHDWSPMDRSIDALVVRLRRKIEPDPAHPTLIKTVRGVGYVFSSDVRRVSVSA